MNDTSAAGLTMPSFANQDRPGSTRPDPVRPRWRWWHWPALAVALLMILNGGWRLLQMQAGVDIVEDQVGAVPVTVYRPSTGRPGPVVVIAHGFAGSRALMRSFALNLARNGFLAVSFDFPGHGDHPGALGGGLGSPERLESLLDALTAAVDYAQSLEHRGGLALLGHSMAGDIMVAYARSKTNVASIVAVSPYLSETVGADFEPDTLFVYGAYEPAMIHEQGRTSVAEVASAEVMPDVTYSNPGPGGARRFALTPGVEHIGVLFSEQSLQEALDWLAAAPALDPAAGATIVPSSPRSQIHSPPVLTAGAGLGWLYAGLCLLAWPLSLLLPPLAGRPIGAALGWGRLLIVGGLPALLTPVLLAPLPNDFLPILIGDYLALHFALYGALTWLLLGLFGDWRTWGALFRPGRGISFLALGVALVTWLAYAVLGFGWPTDEFVASFFPPGQRLPTTAILLVAILLYSLADAWLVHGDQGARGAGIFTKLMFLVSLALAVVLNLDELFFLVIIVPAILLLFVVYGWLGLLAYRRTWHPLPGALASALVFASAITATFPVVV